MFTVTLLLRSMYSLHTALGGTSTVTSPQPKMPTSEVSATIGSPPQ